MYTHTYINVLNIKYMNVIHMCVGIYIYIYIYIYVDGSS